ncbi:MAG: sodium:proton antiporter [Candidatus Zixiibacteriota bacterium]
MNRVKVGVVVSALIALVLFAGSLSAATTAEEHKARMQGSQSSEESHLGERLPLWSCIPFAGVLLSIALIPMIAPTFWHHHFAKIAIGWGLVFALPFFMVYGGEGVQELAHVMLGEYVPFIILLWGLFTVSGGIYISGSIVGRPVVNLTILILGTILASWMGTTGAAMLLIRPLIRANRDRKYKVHTIIFFIFLVANIGGLLTPLGDPPLFLGFLNGVPFFWTFKLWNKLIFSVAYLAILYYIIDSILYRRETKGKPQRFVSYEPLRMQGGVNFVYLLGIIAAVLMSGSWHIGEISVAGLHFTYQSLLRDLLIIGLGIMSLKTTSKRLREANSFSWFPIKEVAYLFIGIFLTIVAPLKILQAGNAGAAHALVSAVHSPASYFWVSGLLSSFLDNAPTYLTFFNMSLGDLGIATGQVHAILSGQLAHPMSAQFVIDLTAISAGAVFFGANTYIGNAPNFMVRSISEESDVAMPSFFGYMLWSGAILIPLFLLMTFVFFK